MALFGKAGKPDSEAKPHPAALDTTLAKAAFPLGTKNNWIHMSEVLLRSLSESQALPLLGLLGSQSLCRALSHIAQPPDHVFDRCVLMSRAKLHTCSTAARESGNTRPWTVRALMWKSTQM